MPVFKAVAKGYPANVFSKWEAVERKAAKIQSDCQKELDLNVTIRVENCASQGDFIVRYARGYTDENVASVMANKAIASKSGQLIAQAIAADASVEPKNVIKSLITNEKKNIINRMLNNATTSLKRNEITRIASVKAQKIKERATSRPSAGR